MKTFIIAEAGANHDKQFQQAIKLIDVAKDSGADAVKFQTYSSETLYVKNTPDFAGYTNINKLIKDIELPREWQKDLKTYCDEKKIEFMSTPFDETAVQELVDLGVKRLKISGFESSDFRFVEMVASTKLPLIISIGIGFPINYIGKILDITERYDNHLTLLHCNNAYPTPIEEISLPSINGLKLRGVKQVGLSDHTMSTVIPALAVGYGATVIEKHYTLSRSLIGPDHPFSLEPSELAEMVELVRKAELAGEYRAEEYTDSEKPFMNARRSVVVTTDLKQGDILTKENISTKRPFFNNCVAAMDYDRVLGKKITKDIPSDTLLTTDAIEQTSTESSYQLDSDFLIISEIEKIRARNNVNWMDAVRLAFELSPNRARTIFKDIKQCDFEINKLLEKLADNDETETL